MIVLGPALRDSRFGGVRREFLRVRRNVGCLIVLDRETCVGNLQIGIFTRLGGLAGQLQQFVKPLPWHQDVGANAMGRGRCLKRKGQRGVAGAGHSRLGLDQSPEIPFVFPFRKGVAKLRRSAVRQLQREPQRSAVMADFVIQPVRLGADTMRSVREIVAYPQLAHGSSPSPRIAPFRGGLSP